MQDFITWGAIALAGGSLATVVKFWMDMGRTQQRADDAADTARLSSAQYALLTASLNEFKVTCANTYVTINGMESAVQGIYQRLDAVTTRLDSLITIAHKQHG